MEPDLKTIHKLYEKITMTLLEKELTITTMESCTAGFIASLLTDTEGSSGAVKGAFITYCNEAKIMQGVPSETIEKYGVYSCETASAMALACKKAYSADIGIGITGTTGNTDPANSDSVPGRVYYAIALGSGIDGSSEDAGEAPLHGHEVSGDSSVLVFKEMLPALEDRFSYKMACAQIVGESLAKILTQFFQK